MEPQASSEPTRTLRIPRGCADPACGAVYYVARVADAAPCPSCEHRAAYELSA